MSISLKLKAQSVISKQIEGIAVHENTVAIGKTGDGYGLGVVTAIMKIGPDSFGDLAKAMMDADAIEAAKAFDSAMANKDLCVSD